MAICVIVICPQEALHGRARFVAFVVVCVVAKKAGAGLADLMALTVIVVIAAPHTRNALADLMTFAVVMLDRSEQTLDAISFFFRHQLYLSQ